jgi:putative NADH-flavin reductase
MNLTLFGATGPTGKCLLQQALDQGHAVTAFARNPAVITTRHPQLTVAKGDIGDAASVESAVQGKDAVLSALGVKQLSKNTILSDGTRNIISAMQKQAVKRFINVSSLHVGDSKGQLGFLFTYLMVPLMLRNAFADKEVQERLIMDSNLDWIIVRPAYLTNGPRRGVYRTWLGKGPGGILIRVSRADVADFMLKHLTDDTYLRKTPGLCY